jgi:hypothetical protein
MADSKVRKSAWTAQKPHGHGVRKARKPLRTLQPLSSDRHTFGHAASSCRSLVAAPKEPNENHDAKVSKAGHLPLTPPTSDTDRLRQELSQCLDDFGFPIVPADCATIDLGTPGFYEATAAAIVQVRRNTYKNTKGVIRLQPISESYGRAVKLAHATVAVPALRHTDATIAACDLLASVECLMELHDHRWKGWRHHWIGIQGILLEGPPAITESRAVRAVLYSAGAQVFLFPTLCGIPSPFEADRWFNATPPSGRHGNPSSYGRLRQSSLRLFIRLPRLIYDVRSLRLGGGTTA